MICWKDIHWLYAIMSILVLMLYYPLAVRTQPIWQQFQPKLTIRQSSVFLWVLVQGKAVLVFVTGFFSAYPAVYLSAVIVMTVGLFVMTRLCSSNTPVVNLWRGTGFMMAAWSAICAVVNQLVTGVPLVPLLMLLIGIGVIFLGALFQTIRRYGPQSDDQRAHRTTMVKQFMRDDVDDEVVEIPESEVEMTSIPQVSSSVDTHVDVSDVDVMSELSGLKEEMKRLRQELGQEQSKMKQKIEEQKQEIDELRRMMISV